MKKIAGVLMLVFTFSIILSNISFAQEITVDIAGKKSAYTGNVYSLELNGVWVPTQTPCIVISGVAYVPLREVFQDYLGMTVGYDNNNGIAYVQQGSKKMEFSFSNQAIYQNGAKVNTHLPVASVNGNIMVPLSLTAGYFGYTVSAKDTGKILTIQWSKKEENTAIVKEAKPSGNVRKISYYTENGKEVIFAETTADKVSRHFVLAPIEGNPYYRLCVQFGNAFIEKPGKLDVYAGSVQQVRYAQVDNSSNTANIVIEINHDPKYSVDVVSNGIKITILSAKSDSAPINTPEPTKAAEPTKAPTPAPTEPPKPSPTTAPSPTPKPSEAPKPSPTPMPTPVPATPSPVSGAEEVGSGAVRYTLDGDELIIWIDGVNLEKEIRENPAQYRVEYRNIEKILQIKMPINNKFKTEALPGALKLHGIITSNNKFDQETTIRISGKEDFSWVLASNGNDGTKIIIGDSNGTVNNPIPSTMPASPTPTPVPSKPATPQATPSPMPTPTPASTPAPTPVPSSDSPISRGGERSGTVTYVAGARQVIIDAAALNDYNVFRLTNPARIVVDIYDNVIESKEDKVPDSWLYTKIRSGQFNKSTARIVLEIPEDIDYETTRNGNRLTLDLSKSGIRNLAVTGDVGTFSIRLAGDGIKDKFEKNMKDIITDNDIISKTFTFLFPNRIIDLGNGKLEIGDTVIKSVHTLTSGNSTFLAITSQAENVEYVIRYTNNGNEVLIEPKTGANTGIGTGEGTGTKPGTGTGSNTDPGNTPDPVPGGKLVVLDAGHGGSDPGATYGKDEKWYNLDITLRLEKLLKDRGVNVKLTRTTDVFVGLDERAEMANEWGADVFISIHHNALMKAMHGTMTFFYTGSYKGKEYATIIHNDMLKNLGSNDLGVRSANFVVLKKTKMPAVLVEIGCLTNDDELAKLNTEEYRQKAAESLCESIIKIISQ